MASGIVSGGGTGGGASLHLYSAGHGFRGETQVGTWRRGVLQEGGLNSMAMVAMAHKEAASGIFSISYSGDLQMMLNPRHLSFWAS